MKETQSLNNLLISQQEMVLIKNSNEAKRKDIYGNLLDSLADYQKLSKRDLQQNIVIDNKAKIVILHNKKDLMNQIIQEWYAIKEFDISDVKKNCQLCGHPNKYIFYIHNRITDIDLHIGSECIKKFKDITGLALQRKRMERRKVEEKQRQRKIEFESLLGDDYEFLNKAENKFSNFKIMLPYSLHYDIKDTISGLKSIKNNYIKNGEGLTEAIDLFSSRKHKCNNLFEEADNYYDSVKESKLICDKITADWLLKNDMTLWEMVAKNNGMFDSNTLKYINLSSYAKRNFEEFKNHLYDKDIKMLKVNGNLIVFEVHNRSYMFPITFSVTIKEFMKTIGCHCLLNLGYKFDRRQLQNISIENTKRNFETVYLSVSPVLKKYGYDFLLEEKTEKAYWKRLGSKDYGRHGDSTLPMYKESSAQLFLSVFSQFILKEESVVHKKINEIVSKMERSNVWITQAEKNTTEQIINEAKGLQKQREFIHY